MVRAFWNKADIKLRAWWRSVPLESAASEWHYVPNWISYARIVASLILPFFMVGGFNDPTQRWWLAGWFAAIALSDGIDGFIARRWKLTSRWGQFIDPIADKILVTTTSIVLVVWYFGQPFGWVVIGSLAFFCARELILTWQIFERQGKVVAPTKLGKWKMVSQSVMLAVWIAPLMPDWASLVAFATVAAILLTFLSWEEYYRKFVKQPQAV